MTSTQGRTSGRRAATPWHLWAVAAAFLLLFAIGAYDYVQVQVESDGYFDAQGYGPEQIEYFVDYPVGPLIFWTVNIVAGLAAVLLLVLRLRWAVPAAAAAVVSQVCLQVVTFGFMDRWDVLGPRLSLTDLGVLLLTGVLWLYCHRMRRRHVLVRIPGRGS